MSVRLITGDCREVLATLDAGGVHTCVTSPPYFGLRDYGCDGQIGLEPTPDAFVAELVSLFGEVRRVLRDDGTLWLNLGDSYATGAGKASSPGGGKQGERFLESGPSGYRGTRPGSGKHTMPQTPDGKNPASMIPTFQPNRMPLPGLKPKDLIGIPWMVAFALRADGWYLRQDIIWSKPNPMPESVTDRCTKAHEYLFLLSKSQRYYYDAEAIAEGFAPASIERLSQPTLDCQSGSDRVPGKTNGRMKAVGNLRKTDSTNATAVPGASDHSGLHRAGRSSGLPPRHSQYPESSDQSGLDEVGQAGTRNRRSVWTVATQPFSEAHFATFPPALIEPCILAGCPIGGHVLDPFGGAGTTGLVADRLGRDATLIELNPAYCALATDRLHADAGNVRPCIGMKESDLQRLIMIAASAEGHRLYRFNVGLGWVGDVVSKTAETITLRNYRPFKAGIPGISDLIGWTRDGRFAAIEVKIGRRQPTEAQSNFVSAARAAGGIGAVVWSVEEALAALSGESPGPIRDRPTTTR